MNSIVELCGVHKTYRPGGGMEVNALRGVSLKVDPGESVAIMGSSGSGKSTLMNILGCLDRPTAGQYRLDGIEVDSLSKNDRADIRSSKIGFVFQDFHLLARTSALENIELPMLYHPNRPSYREMRERGMVALERVGLADRAHHRPNELSGGQQQRVAIARALVNRPSLLLADEPTGNLDSLTGSEIMEVFQELNNIGLTVILVTHEPEIRRFMRRAIILRDGLVRSDTTNQESMSAHEVRKRLQAERDREEAIETSQ